MGMVGQLASLTGTLGASLTNYVQLQASGLANWNSAETRNVQVMPCAGTFSYLLVTCADPSGAATRAFTVRKGLADTTLTCTVTGGSTQASDTSNSFTVVAGDVVDMKQVTSAGVATSTNTTWALKFTATNTNTFPLLWGNATGAGAGTTKYAPYMGDLGVQAATAAPPLTVDYLAAAEIPTAGTISSLYVRLDANMATSSQVFTLYLNGAPTALTCTVASGAATANDTTHTITIAAGDRVSVEMVNNGSNAPRPTISCVFAPTVDGESITCIAQPATHAQAVTRFNAFGGGAGGWASAENTRQIGLIACTVKNLYVTSNPLTTTTVTATVRKAAANTAITAVVTGIFMGPPVQASDTTNTAAFSDFDLIDLQAVTGALTGNVTTMGAVVLLMTQPSTGVTYPQLERGINRGINRGISTGVA